MKRILCYLKTFTNPLDLRCFFNALFTFGAIYIAHDFIEEKTKFNKKTKRIEETLICQRCGLKSISWRQL